MELTKAIVEEWVKGSSGWFDIKALDSELDIGSKQGKSARRVILHRLCAERIIQKHPIRNGVYRLIEDTAPLIEWEEADVGNVVDVKFPFGLEKLVKIYPKNIIVIAGSFNAGKTAFCLNFIQLNMDKFPIVYYSSEMGAEEMKVRLSRFSIDNWKFEARERSSNFTDVIQPDKINIIDYLEITDNFYMVGAELMGIFNRLKKGIAIVALQKKRGAEMGRGSDFSAEKPRLYLTMDNSELKIVKAKNWAIEGKNPNGRKFTFQLVKGCQFLNILEKT